MSQRISGRSGLVFCRWLALAAVGRLQFRIDCRLDRARQEQAINSGLAYASCKGGQRKRAVDDGHVFRDTDLRGEKDEAVGCACWPGRVG